MDEPLRVTRSIVIPAGELRWRFSRSSGPGGQGVNTADSRVELSFDVMRSSALGPMQRARIAERLGGRLHDGVLTIVSSEQRSQLQNRQKAKEKLASVLAGAAAKPPPPRRPTKATRASKERRLADKKKRSQTKKLRRVDDD